MARRHGVFSPSHLSMLIGLDLYPFVFTRSGRGGEDREVAEGFYSTPISCLRTTVALGQ
jgi:hypothetical protein